MKIITSFKIAGLITACLFAAMPTKADIGAISFKTSAAGMNALETTIGSNQMTLETWLYIEIVPDFSPAICTTTRDLH